MASLICLETVRECRAEVDPHLVEDDRVLQNLLRTEDRYQVNSVLFECVQKNEITPDMRNTIAEWMLEVSEDMHCQDDVFPLAMSYLDRLLSVMAVRRSVLQIAASACLLIASKIRECAPVHSARLVYYAGNSFTCQDVWMWEQLILSKLKWDMLTVTAHDFVLPLMRRIPISETDIDGVTLHNHISTFIALCAREFQFSNFTPSIIASACLAASLQGLDWTRKTGCTLPLLINRLCQLTGVEGEYLSNCLQRIENATQEMMRREDTNSGNYLAPEEPRAPPHSALQMTVDKLGDKKKATTPTDIRDIHFP